MRPLVQMIFRVQEVRQTDNGTIYVRGYVLNGRTSDQQPQFATVNVYIPESMTLAVEQALGLDKGQRVFVAGPVTISAYATQSKELRNVYKISYPSAFVPLDTPAAEESASADHESEPQSDEADEPEVVESSGSVKELSGVARPVKRETPAATAAATTTNRRQPQFSFSKPQAVKPKAQVVEESDEDEIIGDPFAEE